MFITGLILRLKEFGESHHNLNQFNNIHELLKNPFKVLATEHTRFSALQQARTLIPLASLKIGEREDYRVIDEVSQAVKIPVTVEFTSLITT